MPINLKNKMKIHLLVLPTIFLAFNSFAQQNLIGAKSPSQFPQKYGDGSPVSFSIDPEIGLEILGDPLHSAGNLVAINSIGPDKGVNTRSVRDAALFKSISPSVVLITTKDGLGTGTFINNQGQILTNYHVVGNNAEVGVILKPLKDTDKISKSDLLRAKVIKVDQLTDLALIQLVQIPAGRQPIKLGDDSEISIGMDAHAIGHPNGESWTYTKGVISQYRNNYEWLDHKASVIQTQTPINPGNSGGPLFSENGTLLGVNSFIDKSAQGLNYAVSIDDVKSFLSSSGSRFLKAKQPAVATKKCEMKEVYKGKAADGKGDVIVWDSKCSGTADLSVYVPYDKSKSIFMDMDRNTDGKIDVTLFSNKRDYKWDISIWDDNYDGKWDLVGYHKNGDIKPYRFEDYATAMGKANK